jgi:hypothetical protein
MNPGPPIVSFLSAHRKLVARLETDTAALARQGTPETWL